MLTPSVMPPAAAEDSKDALSSVTAAVDRKIRIAVVYLRSADVNCARDESEQ